MCLALLLVSCIIIILYYLVSCIILKKMLLLYYYGKAYTHLLPTPLLSWMADNTAVEKAMLTTGPFPIIDGFACSSQWK